MGICPRVRAGSRQSGDHKRVQGGPSIIWCVPRLFKAEIDAGLTDELLPIAWEGSLPFTDVAFLIELCPT
jgi:hypothetical protein